ncbi:MAG: hypothetical protein ABIW31_00795 [Novosphingobium sp.]
MPANRSILPVCLALAGLLSGCGREDVPDLADARDPEVAAALADPLMTDPDLASQNRIGVALTGDGVPTALIPTEDVSNEGRAAAKADVLALLGANPPASPAAAGSQGARAGATAQLSWQQAFGAQPCANAASWTFAWAAQMPAALPVYPRGHVQEALGSNAAGCAMRAVNFRTQVSSGDVLDFYYASARKAGFQSAHRAEGEAHVLSGKQGAAAYAVYARPGPDGMTEVDLVTRGS